MTSPAAGPVAAELPALAAAVGNVALASIIPPPDGGPARGKDRKDLPSAFARERSSMCLREHWRTFSLLGHCTSILISASGPMMTSVQPFDPSNAACRVTERGFGDPNARDDLTGQAVAPCIAGLHRQASASGPQAPTAYVTALFVLSELAAPDSVRALLSAVCDRAPRCSSAQHDAVASVITAGAQALMLAIRRGAENSAEDSTGNASALTQDDDNEDMTTTQGVDANKSMNGDVADVAEAYHTLCRIFEDYVTDHKERAFTSAFMEPSRCAFDWKGDHCGRDHVNVHGLNWGLPVFETALGLAMRQKSVEDPHYIGLIDPWAHMTEDAWTAVWSKPEHFGKTFEGVFKNVHREPAFFNHGGQDVFWPPRSVAAYHRLLSEQSHDAAPSPSIRRFARHIAYFFSAPFFIPKALATLNSETKPEHEGFRSCIRVLFSVFKDEVLSGQATSGAKSAEASHDVDTDQRTGTVGASDDDNATPDSDFDALVFDSYCYKDDMFTEIDVAHVRRFFAWLNFTTYDAQDPALSGAESQPIFVPDGARFTDVFEKTTNEDVDNEDEVAGSEASASVCPLCMVMCDDDDLIHLHDHGTSTASDTDSELFDDDDIMPDFGDAFDHFMCSTCFAEHQKKSSECPFCERGASEPSDAARRLTRALNDAAENPNVSRDNLAGIFEAWEAFEIDTAFSGRSPADVSHELRRAAALVVTDPTLERHVKQAAVMANSGSDVLWLREAAAVFVRFHGLFTDADAVAGARALGPRETTAAEVSTMATTAAIKVVRSSLHPHEIGCAYSQFLAALFAAKTSDQPTAAIGDMTRTLGDSIRPMVASGDTRRVVKERVADFHIDAANEFLWAPLGQKDPLVS